MTSYQQQQLYYQQQQQQQQMMQKPTSPISQQPKQQVAPQQTALQQQIQQQQLLAAQHVQPQQQPAPQVVQPSALMREKAEGAKAYIERKYAKLKNEEKEKKEAWDKLLKQMDKMQLTAEEKELIKQEIQHKEAELFRLSRAKITVRDFEPLKIIGRGAFGEVRVCRNKKTAEVVAIKKMKKTEMIYKNQVAHVRAERDILALAKNDWIVELKCSFQDEKYLYLVMEFLQGGDLMTLLMEKDILSEEDSRFYIAETILAVETVHSLNYIHRDLKPDNLLIGKDGHVKLSDFGLCKHVEIKPRSNNVYENLRKDLTGIPENAANKQLLNRRIEYKRSRQLAYSTVGTPDYIAPEVFGQGGYNETVDWWSVGAILFEMLVGYPPFFSDDPSVTCQKILHWRKTLTIPPEANLSPAATEILKRLMCDAEHRLGANGVEEIKAHPFFEGLDWKNLRNAKAPHIADLTSDDDCHRFDKFDEEEPFYYATTNNGGASSTNAAAGDDKKKRQRKDINFVGYTYKKDVEEQKINLVKVLNESLQGDMPTGSSQASSNMLSSSHSENAISGNSTVGGSTPQQKSSNNVGTADTSQSHSNFYMSQMGQGGHNENVTMMSSASNMAAQKASILSQQQQQHHYQPQNQPQMIKRAPMFTAQTAYHPPSNNHDDDDLLPNEEVTTQPVQTTSLPSNLVKPKIHMANTAYDVGFGAGASSNGVQSLAPSSTQMKGYYQQQQQQMASSHYVVKGGGMQTQQQHLLMQAQQQQPPALKVMLSSQQQHPQSRQPPPDLFVKKATGGTANSLQQHSSNNMMGPQLGPAGVVSSNMMASYGPSNTSSQQKQQQLTPEQQALLMQQLQKKQQQQLLLTQQQQQQLAQQKMMLKIGVPQAGIHQAQQQMAGSSIQKKFIVSSGQTAGIGVSKIGGGMSVQQQQMLNSQNDHHGQGHNNYQQYHHQY